MSTNTTFSITYDADAKRQHVLSLCFSAILCIYSVLSIVCWIDINGFHYSDTPSMFICFSLFFMFIFTLVLFISHLKELHDNTKLAYNVFIAAGLFVMASLYFIGTVLAISSKMYCNYILCEMQMIQLIILPLTMTITLCLDQFDFKNSSCYTQKCKIFKTAKYRIFVYVFIIIMEALFNICSPYQPHWLYILHIVVLILSFILLVSIICKPPICLTGNVLKMVGLMLPVFIFIIAIFNIYALIANDVYDLKWIYHHLLLMIVGWLIGVDIICYIKCFIYEYGQYKQIANPKDSSLSTSTASSNNSYGSNDNNTDPIISSNDNGDDPITLFTRNDSNTTHRQKKIIT